MQEKTQATNNSSVERAHSRSSLSNLTTADYQVVLRLAFVEWGLPDRLAVDHDRVFYDNLSPLPFPTRLQLWLLALGVELTFARKHRPTDQAAHRAGPPDPEGQQFVIWDALRAALDARRRFLTDRLGCASLQRTAPPLQAHPAVRPPRHPYRPAWEADLLGLQRVSTYLSQGRWFRQVNSTGTLALGGEVCHVGRAWARQEVALTFDPTAQQLQVWGPQEHLLKGVPIQGLSPTQLMEEAGSLVHLRPFQ